MSKGMGAVESRIAQLIAATRNRDLTVDELAEAAFQLAGRTATRAQRLSATRAGHRLLRRMREAAELRSQLIGEAHRETEAAVGPRPTRPKPPNTLAEMAVYEAADNTYSTANAHYNAALEGTTPWRRAEKLRAFGDQFGSWTRLIPAGPNRLRAEQEFWRATVKRGVLYFHPPDVPVRVWAVSIQPAGVIWAEAHLIRIAERSVMISYGGETARLDRRKLWEHWALWRGVYFVSSRSGYAAQMFDAMWQHDYGHAAGGVPPVMQVPLAEAMALLGVPANFTHDDVIAAFRREAKKAHPDAGGTAEMFQKLIEARDRLLASLGASAPPPTPPQFTPKGMRVQYQAVRLGGQARLGSTRRLSR